MASQAPCIFDKEFQHESKPTKYQVFVGSQPPDPDKGKVGDIWILTTHEKEITEILKHSGNVKMERPENHEKHHVYYKDVYGWTVADRHRHQNGKPYTKHPSLGAYFLLDDFLFKWRSVSSYYNTNRKTSNQRVSVPRDRDPDELTIGGEQKSIKRARSESPCPVVNHENAWILDEYKRWTEPPITFAAHETVREQGKRILQKLAGLSYRVPSWPHKGPELANISIVNANTNHIQLKPDMTHVVADLLQASKNGDHISIVNFVLNRAANHNTVDMVINSLIMSGDRYDTAGSTVVQIGALTIPASFSGLANIDLLPKLGKDVVFRQRNIEKRANMDEEPQVVLAPGWESSLIPTGAVTGPRMDYCGCSQLIQHIQGRKLWLFWPPTPHNLDVYLRQHLTGNLTFSIEDAIDQLKGLELLLLDSDQTRFIVPGGTIHAVVTFTHSCDTRLKLWRLQDFQVTESMNMIQVKVMDKKEELDKDTYHFYQDYFRTFKEELKNWDELGKKKKKGTAKLHQWILESEKMLESMNII